MNTTMYPELKNLDPFFDVIKKGLNGLVDGEHFFDMLSEDTCFEFRYRFPGLPEKISGRNKLLALFKGICDDEILYGSDGLIVHKSQDPHVVVLEYEVHGKIVASG